jgi:hypothetical protein
MTEAIPGPKRPNHPSSIEEGTYQAPEVVASDGYVHVAVQQSGPSLSTPPAYYVRWNGSGWSEVTQPISLEATAQDPGLALGPQHKLHVLIRGNGTDGDVDGQDGLYYTVGTIDEM